jgi:hypothetical protein
MSIASLLATVTPGAVKPDAEFERRYKLVAEADSLASGHYTEYAHAICQTKMLAEILAILATKEHNGH